MSGAADDRRRTRALDALRSNPVGWYHTIELAPGIVTGGEVDMRGLAGLLPADLAGKRALDVGTFDGFWAFEMERRGAEVVAIDVDRVEQVELPPPSRERILREAREQGFEPGVGFHLAAQALGSRVRRVGLSVYELTADAIGGPVDLVFSGAILLHLRDPVGALERIRRVIRPAGELRMLELFSAGMSLRSPRRPAARFRPLESSYTWWLPNLACLRAWPLAAGFDDVRRIRIARPPSPHGDFYAGLRCRP